MFFSEASLLPFLRLLSTFPTRFLSKVFRRRRPGLLDSRTSWGFLHSRWTVLLKVLDDLVNSSFRCSFLAKTVRPFWSKVMRLLEFWFLEETSANKSNQSALTVQYDFQGQSWKLVSVWFYVHFMQRKVFQPFNKILLLSLHSSLETMNHHHKNWSSKVCRTECLCHCQNSWPRHLEHGWMTEQVERLLDPQSLHGKDLTKRLETDRTQGNVAVPFSSEFTSLLFGTQN